MRLVFLIILTFNCSKVIGQNNDSSFLYLGLSVGHLVKVKNIAQSETLINLDSRDNVSGNITFGFQHSNKFGVIMAANFAEYSLNLDTYDNYIKLKYPTYFLLTANKSQYKQYNLKLGTSYLFRYKGFEFISALMLGRYFYFEEVKANLIIKEDGSNFTREINYLPTSKKYLINFSGELISKYTFKSGLGFHFIFDYCHSKPVIKYLVSEKEFLSTTYSSTYEKKLNLSTMNFLFGMHCNFNFKKAK